eukprot:m51a1_g1337 putative phosphatidylinositol 4-kinase (1839) ;mRNA; f:312747-319090
MRIALAEALAESSKAERVPGAVPSAAANEFVEMCRDRHHTFLHDARAQANIIAATHYIQLAQTGPTTNSLVAILLEVLPTIVAMPDVPLMPQEALASFVSELSTQVVRISRIQESSGFALSTAFIPFYRGLLENDRVPDAVKVGMLDALSGALPELRGEDETSQVSSPLVAIVSKTPKSRLAPAALGVLAAIAAQESVQASLLKELYHLAMTESVLQAAYVPALRLASECAHRSKGAELDQDLVEALEAALGAAQTQGPTAEYRDLAKFALGALVRVHESNPVVAASAVDIATQFALATPQARDEASTAICSMLGSPEASMRYVSSLLEKISAKQPRKTTSVAPQAAAAPAAATAAPAPVSTPAGPSAALQLLRMVVCKLKDQPKVVEAAEQGLCAPVSSAGIGLADIEIVAELVPIAALGIPSVSADSSSLMVPIDLVKRVVKDMIPVPGQQVTTEQVEQMQGMLAELARHLLSLAQQVKPVDVRSDICRRVMTAMQNFVKTLGSIPGVQIYNHPNIRAIGHLIPVVAELAGTNDDKTIFKASENDRALFRSIWVSCVMLDFVTRGKTQSDWVKPITQLAVKIPVLTIGASHQFMKIEKEMETMLLAGFESKDTASIKHKLSKHLPSTVTNLKYLTLPQCAYILSVHYLEKLRARSGEYRALFSYLEDPVLSDTKAIPNMPYIAPAFRTIADEVYSELVMYLRNPRYDTADRLSYVAQHLLLNYCHLNETIRATADAYISNFVGCFPHVLWNRRCLDTLLEILQFTASSLSSNPLDPTHLQVSGTDYYVDLPEEKAAAERLFQNVADLCSKWVRQALRLAPAETLSVLHDYTRKMSGVAQELGSRHFGISLASELVSREEMEGRLKPKGSDKPLPTCFSGGASRFVTGLANKSRYIGEIEGMLSVFTDLHGPEDPGARVASLLSAKIDDHIKADDHNAADFGADVFRACALLVSRSATLSAACVDALLSRVAWAPVRMFTTESLEVAISAWSWIIAACPELSDRLMAQMYLAWSWTIDMRVGLFTDAQRQNSPLAVPSDAGAAGAPSAAQAWRAKRSGHEPHRLWLRFLAELTIVSENSNNMLLDTTFKMVYKACADPLALSILPESMGTRFHLLLLALDLGKMLRERANRIARTGARLPAQAATDSLFVDRIHACALSWFTHYPTWYEPPTRKELEEDAAVLVRFCEKLVLEGRKIPSVGTRVPSSRSSVRSASSASSLISPGIDAPSSSSYSASLVEENAERRKRGCLIALLVGNELERVAVWNNPINRLTLQIADQSKFTFENMPRDAKLQWKEYVDIAWMSSPEIVVMLKERFPDAALHKLVADKVLRYPAAFVRCPEALSILVTEENVKRDIPQLRHLMYWATCDPLAALSMLRSSYQSHPIVTRYALRVLTQFTPETIIFYMPQLVQCLRHDKSGLVADYLVDAASKSEFLAHQLVWNGRTYPRTCENPKYKIDPEFSEKVEAVLQRVLSGFTPEQRKRYDEEFGFFDQFTTISGKLIPVPAENRKQKLVEELRKVKCDGSLYLPFNSSIVVKSVNTEDPVVLRSAAKVPIMVHFGVNKRSAPADAAPTKHSVIFKSGDDIRQDMLAVQVIELFKRIFESAGLDLFLFPYKIIATKPECGLIEVVPDTVSRDQLGDKTGLSMYDYFLRKYGDRYTTAFQKARNNFIKSMAAYAVVSYMLQIKDRHNGNILIDGSGHLVHIDFGFLFDISPGGDIGFERAPFKLTEEMMDIMGGHTSDQFIWFMEQGVRAYLAARQYKDSVITLVELMLETQLPCFKPVTMDNLEGRFTPGVSIMQAAKAMGSVMQQALATSSTAFTTLYDMFQRWDNGINM